MKIEKKYYLCHWKEMINFTVKSTVIIRFVILGLLWGGLSAYIIANTKPFTLYTVFVIVAAAIIIFVPMYKKYVKNDKS